MRLMTAASREAAVSIAVLNVLYSAKAVIQFRAGLYLLPSRKSWTARPATGSMVANISGNTG